MKLRKTLAAAGALAIAGGTFALKPAAANTDTVDETILTYTLTGGALFIDAPASGTASGAVGGAPIQMAVDPTSVTNNAGLGSGWTVTAQVTDFAYDDTNAGGADIPCSNFSWITGSNPTGPLGVDLGAALNLPSGAVAFADPETDGTCVGAGVVIAGVNLLAGGTYTYTGTGTLVVPPTALAGDYTATLTQTVAAASVS